VFALIGPDEPYRIIVANNPVNNVDPLGLAMAGLPNHVNPGAYPNLANLLNQFAWFNWYKDIDAMNAADNAIFEESNKLDCDKPYDYYIYYGKWPMRFIGIGPKGEGNFYTYDIARRSLKSKQPL